MYMCMYVFYVYMSIIHIWRLTYMHAVGLDLRICRSCWHWVEELGAAPRCTSSSAKSMACIMHQPVWPNG